MYILQYNEIHRQYCYHCTMYTFLNFFQYYSTCQFLWKGDDYMFSIWLIVNKKLDLFLYSYEAWFIQKLLRETFYLLTIINSIRLSIRYIPMNWKSKTPQCATCASYLDILLKLNTNGKITTQLHDKRYDFNFSIFNFHYLCSNIPVSPAYDVCVYIEAYSLCKSLLDIQTVFSSRQSTDKQVDVTGVSTVSSTGSFPQILWWSLQRSYLPMQPFVGAHAVWYISYQSISRSWHSDLDYGSYRLSNLEIGLTADVIDQQGMLTPPWHLIPPL
jgi:hypothetical protein